MRVVVSLSIGSKITIRETIERLRIKKRLDQDDLGWKVKLKCSTLAKIEGDFVKKPGVQLMAKIAKALGVAIEDLLK